MFRSERLSELLAGGASSVILVVDALFWAFLQSAELGSTMKRAVQVQIAVAVLAVATGAGALVWSGRSAMKGDATAHWGARTSQLACLVLCTFLAGGVFPRTSLASVYQKGQADPQVNNAVVLCWFSWVWTVVWVSLRTWNDAAALQPAAAAAPAEKPASPAEKPAAPAESGDAAPDDAENSTEEEKPQVGAFGHLAWKI